MNLYIITAEALCDLCLCCALVTVRQMRQLTAFPRWYVQSDWTYGENVTFCLVYLLGYLQQVFIRRF